MTPSVLKSNISSGALDADFAARCGIAPENIPAQRERALRCTDLFSSLYGAEREVSLLSVGGRSEISGNHTDHNHGRVIAASIVQIANHDKIGQFSASNIVDGTIKMEIAGVTKAALTAKDGVLTFSDKVPKNYLSSMTFADVKTARDLFDGKINAVAAVGNGGVKMAGMISQIDNLNRILSRVELYLK